ncbi:aldolase/citrate lyase family protein [Candidatus Njordibacter sp. Uisw_039]|uniref:HpcH/HpaI aldolase family protein n=1 Tax=Candidatus Njordibacter sp. Uisw_039 TaxID=3230972 RepID=UPI003D4CD6E8
MNRLVVIKKIRECLQGGGQSIGSWMQIPHASVAEIMGQAGYDWVAVDMEHGAIGAHQLPDLFRALELGETLPLVRLSHGHPKDCKQALDAGAGGVIVPMVDSADQLLAVRDACRWPPAGTRGVGFSRANLFGKNFEAYREEAQVPLLVAMIEHFHAVENLEKILEVEGLDAILIGPYDLSASMGMVGQFDHPDFQKIMTRIRELCTSKAIACGVHVVQPSEKELWQRIDEGYRFLAYSIDSVFLNASCVSPLSKDY